MKGFFWIAACGLAAIGGVAIKNGSEIGSVLSEVAESDRVIVDVTDGGDIAVRSDEADSAEANAAEGLDEAIEALSAAQERIAEIRADTSLSDAERSEALSKAEADRAIALAKLTEEPVAEPADDQPRSVVEERISRTVDRVFDGIEQSDADVVRDGKVLSGEERAAALKETAEEINQQISDAFEE
ncbi:hypothetical protein [Sphingomicrobium flavum]|uniref:hypothetical protein n=1 Tax=Sphingomicrobium flavum TaxID=1229164 RepID=UPI0021AE21F5|nr:hypothetical protein [Sphingomicrobium flavum]